MLPFQCFAYDSFNCWDYATERIGKRIPAKELLKNTAPTPQVGSIAVMRYEKQGLDHFSYVEYVGDNYVLISETNYNKGKFGYRIIPLDYPHLVGFYSVD